jgi:type VI secretion system secreted protein Hcp
MAQADYFLKLNGIDGESEVKGHEKEIQISSFSFGCANQGSGGYGGGSGSSKASVQDIHITKQVDNATPNLYKYCFQGNSIDQAIITVRKAGGDDPLDYLTMTLTEVFVSSVSTSGHDGGGIAQESLSLNFSKVHMVYKLQDPTGAGQDGPDITIDVKQHTVS